MNLDHIEFYWEVFKEGTHDFFDASRYHLMRAEAPSWPVSNFFNVRFVLAFLFIYSLTLLYDNYLEIASAFLKIF